MLAMISLRRVSLSKSVQKPGIWLAIAVLTSASLSFNNFTKAGTRSRVTTSSLTAFAIFSNFSATIYLTLQLLSSNRLRRAVSKTPWLGCCSFGMTSSIEIKTSTVNNRTLS